MAKQRKKGGTPKSGDRKELDRIVRSVLDQLTSGGREREQAALFDLSGPVLQRRKEAVMACLPRYRERYQAVPGERDLLCQWAELCFIPRVTVYGVDQQYQLTLAAALWILDELDESGRLPQALPYLDAPEKELQSITLPELTHPRCSPGVIRGMVRLLRCRNGGTEQRACLISSTTAPLSGRTPEPEAGLEQRPVEELTVRERLRVLLSWLDPAHVKKATDHFTLLMWDFLDQVMLNILELEKQKAELKKRYTRSSQDMYELVRSIHSCLPDADGKTGPMAEAGPWADRYHQWLTDPFGTEAVYQENRSRGAELFGELDRQADRLREILESWQWAVQFAHTAVIREPAKLLDRMSERMAERVTGLSVDDPLELCFAYFWLVETGDQLPWLYNPPLAVLLAAGRRLPWCPRPFAEDDWEAGDKPLPEHADMGMAGEAFYRLCYEDGLLYAPEPSPYRGWRVNLAQLLYGLKDHTLMCRRSIRTRALRSRMAREWSPDPEETMELCLELNADCGPVLELPSEVPAPVEEVLREREEIWTQERSRLEEQLSASCREHEEESTRLREQLSRRQSYQARLEEEKRELRRQLEEQEKHWQARMSARNEELAYLHRCQDRPREHSQIAAWVRRQFGDRLCLHPRAEGELAERSARSVDAGLICDALDFLATDYWERRYGGLSRDDMNTRCGEKYGRPFAVTPIGSATIAYTPQQYKVRFPRRDGGREEERELDYHLRVGNDPENLLRIYFFHDDTRRQLVVGSLPGHLRAVSIR